MKFCQFLVVVLLYYINYVKSVSIRVDPLVLIEQGLVKGIKSSDGEYSSFLGIPYAKVDRRNPFGPFKPHPGFGDKIFNAFDDEIKCPQLSTSNPSLNIKQDLDCLNLNVYAPSGACATDLLPVLVYIHGGDFVEGYSTDTGVRNLVRQGIVVVTLNYRLGAYGFLCLDSSLAPGNQGLKDQYEALRWIKKNIYAFGGNPNDVTLAGVNAGSVSIMLHLYSSREKLFNKIISQSCAPLSEDLFSEGDVDAACKIATHLGHVTKNTTSALKFLSKTSYELVTAAVKEMGLIMRPCKEKKFDSVEPFIDCDPFTMSNLNNLRNLIGSTGYGVPYGLFDYYVPPVYLNYPFSFPFHQLTKNFNFESEHQVQLLSESSRQFHTRDEHFSQNSKETYFGTAYNYPIQRAFTNIFHESSYSVNEYVFSYLETGFTVPAIDIYYSLEDYLENDKQKLIADRFLTLCANFVKYGYATPVVQAELVPIAWAPMTRSTRPYLVVDTDLRMEQRYFRESNNFWNLFHTAYENYNK